MTFDKAIQDTPFSEMIETELVENEEFNEQDFELDFDEDLV